MTNQLKSILNSYENLEDIELWVNSERNIEAIIVDDGNINLITNAEIKVNGQLREKEVLLTIKKY